MTVEEIGVLLQKNDKSAFYYCLKICSFDRDKSLDLLQEAKLKVLLNKDKYTPNPNLKNSFLNWYSTIIRNTSINIYRETIARMQPTDTIETLVKDTVDNIGESKVQFDELQNCVNDLKPKLRESFELMMEGFKYHEISKQLGVPEGTIKNRIFKAREFLQNKIEKINKVNHNGR